MAFALPSFNAAVASAQSSGLPLQRLQANIDFDDVNVNYATKLLGKQALEEFVTEANIAKQALGEYGANIRQGQKLEFDREVLEARKDQLDQNRKDSRRARLFEMLGGGLSMLGDDLLGTDLLGETEKLPSPREEMGTEMLFRRAQDQFIGGQMGDLNPAYGQRAVASNLNQVAPKMPLSGAGVDKGIAQIYQIKPPETPKLEAPKAASMADLYQSLIGLSGAGRTPQTK